MSKQVREVTEREMKLKAFMVTIEHDVEGRVRGEWTATQWVRFGFTCDAVCKAAAARFDWDNHQDAEFEVKVRRLHQEEAGDYGLEVDRHGYLLGGGVKG